MGRSIFCPQTEQLSHRLTKTLFKTNTNLIIVEVYSIIDQNTCIHLVAFINSNSKFFLIISNLLKPLS